MVVTAYQQNMLWTKGVFLLKSYIVQNGPKSFHFWATFVGEFVTKAPPKLVQSGYFAED